MFAAAVAAALVVGEEIYQGNSTQSVESTEPIKTFERTARDIGINERELPIIAKFLEELRKLGCD